MTSLWLIGAFALGAVASGVLFRALLRARLEAKAARAEAELKAQLATLAERAERIPPLEKELAAREQELAGQRQQNLALELAQSKLNSVLEAERKAAQEKLALLEEAKTKFSDAFNALAAQALKSNNQSFLELARQSLEKFQQEAKGDLDKRQESIKTLVTPLEEQLKAYQQRLQQSETSQAAALGEVKKQLESLGTQSLTLAQETQQFRLVLKSNQARGRWGEETLRRVVEAAGMSAHCDFTLQSRTEDTQPDMIVRLPGDRMIIVDAKVPDMDFLNAIETAEGAPRSEALARHATRLKETIKALADRDYPGKFPNALDHVVLFLPAESLFSAALEGDRDLIVWAANKHILLATPASLIALLRSVSVSWRQHAQTENAQAIAKEAQVFYSRVMKFMEHIASMREGLQRASNKFNEAVSSYESRVRPSGERLLQLGGASDAKGVPALPPLEATLAAPTSAPSELQLER